MGSLVLEVILPEEIITDSQTALTWIKEGAPEETLSSRTEWRRSLADPDGRNDTFRHVRTDLNPADAPTRGESLSARANNEPWKHGPAFLLEPAKSQDP